MKSLKNLTLLLMLLSTSAAWADGFDWRKFYLGAGFGSAVASGADNNASATQVLLGYPLSKPGTLVEPKRYELGIEVGYLDVSDNDLDGLWITPSATRYLGNDIGVMLRLGYENGDNSGLIGALGFDYRVDANIHTRLEHVERQKASAVVLNIIYRP